MVLGIVILCLIPFAVWLAFRLLRDFMKDSSHVDEAELCNQCGYDLRATPDMCPECGLPNERHQRRLMLQRLREDWPDEDWSDDDVDYIEPSPPADREAVFSVYETRSEMELNLWTEQFLTRGIWCAVRESDVRIGAQSETFYHLTVRKDDLHRARDLVTQFVKGESTT